MKILFIFFQMNKKAKKGRKKLLLAGSKILKKLKYHFYKYFISKTINKMELELKAKQISRGILVVLRSFSLLVVKISFCFNCYEILIFFLRMVELFKIIRLGRGRKNNTFLV